MARVSGVVEQFLARHCRISFGFFSGLFQAFICLARNRFGHISPYKKLARRFGIWRGIFSGFCSGLFRVFVGFSPGRDAAEPFGAAKHIFARREARTPEH